ncbi:FAFR398Wp [Eremothecium gossypii FDAG1]|nr:FAFR398Wp [Eremothecium gossypii FDAG1]
MASAVLYSRFSPDGAELATVTAALGQERIAVVSVGGARTDAWAPVGAAGVTTTSLGWVRVGDAGLVAVGRSDGTVGLYSAVANRVVQELATGAAAGVRDVQTRGDRALVLAGGALYEFSLEDFTLVRQLRLAACADAGRLCVVDEHRVLLASHTVTLVDLRSESELLTFPGHLSAVTTLYMLDEEHFLSGAADDRFLNVYNLETGATKAVLVATANIARVSHTGSRAVAVSTEEGRVEVFADPLVSTGNKRRGNLSKQPTHTVRVARDGSSDPLPLFNCYINGDIATIVWLENATEPHFERVQWEALSPAHTIFKARPATKSASHRSKSGSDVAAAKTYKEGNATVTSGDNFRHIQQLIDELQQADLDGSENQETLQDRLLGAKQPQGNKSSKKNQTVGTLTVVLSQALQSNDHSLLETVLNTRDERLIQATVTKLKPALSVTLLERLAERIARQTNRQGLLIVWCKWCLIAHGGYLITIPNLIAQLASLHSTLKKRSEQLPRLQLLEAMLNSCVDDLAVKRSSSFEDYTPTATVWEDENESDVEYNEELDDAGLIEDGELDESDDDDDDDDETAVPDGEQPAEAGLESSDDVEDEHGYSDVETH